MSYGMQILRPDGNLWLSPEVTPMNLIDKGVMAGINGEVFQTRIPSGIPAIFFVRMQNELYASFSQIDQNGYNSLRIDVNAGVGSIHIYAFAAMVVAPPAFGIAMYDASGKMIYHGNMRPLECYQVASEGTNTRIDVGYLAAVCPVQMSVYSVVNSSVGGWNIFVSSSSASGSIVSTPSRQVANTSGPAGFIWSNSMLVINASKYD